jgi:choline dehydrogenase-like flavoprotein
LAVTDFYFGHSNGSHPPGPWGVIQSLQVPTSEFMKTAPVPAAVLGRLTLANQIVLICIAEDIPRFANRVVLHPTRRDRFGKPIALVHSKYHGRDIQRRRALCREGGRILRQAGAVAHIRIPVNTFSHAMGTCRFGPDPASAVLDPACRFFGVPNLFVVDASFMPTSAGMNPSLTIAANALRVGEYIVRNWTTITTSSET